MLCLSLFMPFPVLLICFCRYRFLSLILFLTKELLFLWYRQAGNEFVIFYLSENFYLIFNFERFCLCLEFWVDFFFYHFKEVSPLLMSCIVFDQKSALILIFVSLSVSFFFFSFPVCLQDSLFIFGFQQFDYNGSTCVQCYSSFLKFSGFIVLVICFASLFLERFQPLPFKTFLF